MTVLDDSDEEIQQPVDVAQHKLSPMFEIPAVFQNKSVVSFNRDRFQESEGGYLVRNEDY